MKLTERKLRRAIRQEIRSIVSEVLGNELDSQYFMRQVKSGYDDFVDTSDEKKFINYVIDRVNQMYPDEDISLNDLIKISNEPQIRAVSRRVNGKALLKFIWDALH